VKTRVAFVSIRGTHQVFHLAPVAAALSIDAPDLEVRFLAGDERSFALAERASALYPAATVRFERLRRARLEEFGSRVAGRPGLSKLPTPWRNRRTLAEFDAIVVAECTWW
jgi:hypothetical protein